MALSGSEVDDFTQVGMRLGQRGLAVYGVFAN